MNIPIVQGLSRIEITIILLTLLVASCNQKNQIEGIKPLDKTKDSIYLKYKDTLNHVSLIAKTNYKQANQELLRLENIVLKLENRNLYGLFLCKKAELFQTKHSQLDSCIYFYNKAFEYSFVRNKDTSRGIAILNNRIITNLNKNDFSKYIEDILLMRQISISSRDSFGLISSYVNLLGFYGEIDSITSEKYIQEGLCIYSDSLIKNNVSYRQKYIQFLFLLSNFYAKADKPKKSRYYIEKYYILSQKYPNEAPHANFMIGICYLNIKEYDSAYKHLYEIIKQIERGKLITIHKDVIFTFFSHLCLERGDIVNASKYINKVDITQMGVLNGVRDYYDTKIELYRIRGDYKNIYIIQKKLTQCEDSISKSLYNFKNIALNIKYETAQKDKKILEQELEVKEISRKRMLYLAAFILTLLSGGFFFYYIQNKRKQEKQKLVAEISNMQEKLSNTLRENESEKLNTIVQTQEQERTKIAMELHDNIGAQLNAIKLNLNTLHSSTAYIKSEVSRLDDLLLHSIQSVRTISHRLAEGNVIHFDFVQSLEELKETIEKSHLHIQFNYFIPDISIFDSSYQLITLYRIIQEFCTNSIKHSGASEINLNITKDQEGIDILLEDNGKGFKSDLTTKGIGLTNMKKRADDCGLSFHIESSEKSGTTLQMHQNV